MTSHISSSVIIDTDPGLDDAIAILLALASPELEVLGLTTVAGNLGLDVTTGNALRLVELVGRPDLPVAAGCARPLVRPSIVAEDVHGSDGLGGADIPPATARPIPVSAVDWLAETVRSRPAKSVTLCALGPLTNVATLMTRHPDTALRLARIIAMGGAIAEPGNITPAAEFNMIADPHAAAQVLEGAVPVTLVPLDVTRRVRATPGWARALARESGRGARAAAALVDAYFVGREGPGVASRPLHDPCVVLECLAPGLFDRTVLPLQVDCRPGPRFGATAKGPADGHAVEVLVGVDSEQALGIVADRLARI